MNNSMIVLINAKTHAEQKKNKKRTLISGNQIGIRINLRFKRGEQMAVEIKVIKRRKLSKAERTEIHNKYDGHCAYCGCEIDFSKMQVDHAKPLRIGGTDTMDNMMPACRSCNSYKTTLDVEGFRNYEKNKWLYEKAPKEAADLFI